VVNANLKLNLGAMGQGLDGSSHHRHLDHDNLPAGLMFAHTLDREGDFMAGYRYQHNRQAGGWLQGDHQRSISQAGNQACPDYRFDSVTYLPTYNGTCFGQPTDMTQSMHMLELMYAVNDRLTLMLMPQFMDMQMLMGSSPSHKQMNMTSDTGVIGDTGAYALLTLFDTPNHHLHASLGGTAPTGNAGKRYNHDIGASINSLANNYYMEYGMQVGSGSWDFKPSLTYSGKQDHWNWGGQIAGTKRMAAANSFGYRMGDVFEGSVWGGYSWSDWLANTLRLAYRWQDRVHGSFSTPQGALPTCNQADFTYGDLDYDHPDADGNPTVGPPYLHQADYQACLNDIAMQKKLNGTGYRSNAMYYPQNYGGHYLDLGLGVALTIPNGAFAGHKLAFEWQQPLYTNVNGYQLNRDHALTFTWSMGF
jgi:hypothetical protein